MVRGIPPFMVGNTSTFDVAKPGATGEPVPAELPYTTTFFTAVSNVVDGVVVEESYDRIEAYLAPPRIADSSLL